MPVNNMDNLYLLRAAHGGYSMASGPPAVQGRRINRHFLSCGICYQQYRNPKVLPCLHTFCEACLHSYIPEESISVTCPTCRQQSILPQEGVTALQTNIFINKLLDIMTDPDKLCSNCDQKQQASSKCTHCEAFLCDRCIQPHIMENDSVTHHVISMNEVAWTDGNESKSMSLNCSNHQGQHLNYYCIGCETAICQACSELEHHTHETVPLCDAIQEHRNILTSLLQKAQTQIPVITDAFSVIQTVSDTLSLKYESVESQIQDAFDTIQKLLNQRKAAILEELKIVYKSKSNTLKEQEKELEETLKQVNKCCEFTQDALDHGNETEILLVSKEMSEKLESFGLPPSQRSPEENDFLEFSSSDFNTAKKLIQQLGSIQSNSAVAFETVATGEGLKKCHVGKTALVNITTKDKNGDLIRVGHASFSAQLMSNSGTVIIPDILDNKNGTYDLSYDVTEAGTYSLDIRLFDQPIRGSPFKVKARPESESLDQVNGLTKIPKTSTVKQKGTKRTASSRSHGSNRRSNPVEDDLLVRVGSKGRNKGEFTNPQGICCTVAGKILVADSNNQCVQAFTNTGDVKLKFGVRGRTAGQLQRPTGVAETVNGNFLVADYDNRWVSVFSPDGKYINKLGTGKLLGPKGVVVDNNGHIIVVDNKASCVFIFQANGKLIHKFGSRGNNEYQFAGPHFCAVNSRNDIIVSDFHNHCVKVFDSEGTFRFHFGSNGEGNGQFNAPTGVAVDRMDNILVADWGNSRIQIFDSEGSFLSYINTSADPLYGPQGLAVTPEGHVTVADSGNHCFKIYRYLQ